MIEAKWCEPQDIAPQKTLRGVPLSEKTDFLREPNLFMAQMLHKQRNEIDALKEELTATRSQLALWHTELTSLKESFRNHVQVQEYCPHKDY
jgi:hypothetical protein